MPERLSRIWLVVEENGLSAGEAFTDELEARRVASCRVIPNRVSSCILYGSVMDLDCEQEKLVAQGDEACREHL